MKIYPRQFFVLLFTTLGLLARLSATAPLPATAPGAALNCPAPAPTNVTIVDVTPTSITLVWLSGASYHQVQTYDITGGVWLPTLYVATNGAVIDSLTPGHCYRFEVSSSYCEDGPYGPETEREGCAGVIIIETVMEIQEPPTLVPGPKTGAGTTLEYCLAQSTSPDEPFDNAFVGALAYGNQALEFALALTPDHALHFGPTGNTFFTFDTINGGSTARCKLNNQVVFTVQYLEDSPIVGIGLFRLNFVSSCTGFQYGGTVSCNGMPRIATPKILQQAENYKPDAELRDDRNQQVPTRLLPNPFDRSATLYCETTRDGPLTVSLFDAQGRLLRIVEDGSVGAGRHTVQIPGSDLPNGVYFIGIQTAETREMLPLLKRE